MDVVLDITGLTYRYPDVRSTDRRFEVRLPRLKIGRGELIALVGQSGSGKSTLLDLLGLILPPSRLASFVFRQKGLSDRELGQLILEGDIDALADFRRNGFGYVPQQGGLLPFLNVHNNIDLGNIDLGRERDANLGWSVAELAERLGLADLLQQFPRDLSIGQRQRVSIARALLGEPDIVLADEPTASLDPMAASEVLNLFVDLARRRGTGVLIANHDWALVADKGFSRVSPQITHENGLIVASFTREISA